MDQRNIRLVAVGDDLLAGVGDPRALGWFGRVMARTPQTSASISAYNLAAPGEGTELLNSRWFDEASRRFGQGTENRLIIAPSTLDVDLDITSARSRLNLANMVDMASQNNVKVLVVGPPPPSIPSVTAVLPTSMLPTPMWSPAVTTSTLIPSTPCSTTSSGAMIWLPMTAAPASLATA